MMNPANQTFNPAQSTTPQVASRIDAEVERLRSLTQSVWTIHERIMRHSKSLGFLVDTPASVGPNGTLQGVPTTLRDAIDQLEAAINVTSGGLNVFD